jgi:putative phosphoribosyl transferase
MKFCGPKALGNRPQNPMVCPTAHGGVARSLYIPVKPEWDERSVFVVCSPRPALREIPRCCRQQVSPISLGKMTRLPFQNRAQAGRLLAPKVAAAVPDPGAVIVALPRGGVPVAREIARALKAPLDLLIVRKLGVPGQEELAFGALASGGQQFIDHTLVASLQLTPAEIQAVVWDEEKELKRREKLYRGKRPALALKEKTVVLVDDGMATGSTMTVAIQAAHQMRAGRVVVAAPVASQQACVLCQTAGARCVCLATPDPFEAVGLWYKDFSQVTDGQIRDLLSSRDSLS